MIACIFHKTSNLGVEIVFSNSQFETISKIQTTNNHGTKYSLGGYTCISNSNLSIKSNPSQYILELYQKKGIEALDLLRFEFSFGIVNQKENFFFGARDAMGIKPFYYYNSDNIFIYSTDIKWLKQYLKQTELSKDWILSSLTGSVYDKTTSPIKDIKKLAPAHYLILENGKISISRYWELTKQALPILSEQDYILELKTLLVKAVESRINGRIGAELSGGLDSSAIVGIIAQNNPKIITYTHTLADALHGKILPYKDERYYRDLVLNQYQQLEFRNIDAQDKGLFYELQDELKRQLMPVNNTLAYLSDSVYDIAMHDRVNTLFSGFGGDEGISNFANIIPHQYAKQFRLRALKQALGKNYFSKEWTRQLLISQFPFLRPKRQSWREQSYGMQFLNTDFTEQIKAKTTYFSYHNSKKPSTLDEYLSIKLNENYISNRIEATGASARTRGIEYTFPLLDIDLISYYYNLPDAIKYKNGMGRYAYREAIKTFVPKEIYLRTDKTGATVPSVLARFKKDYTLIEDFLQSVKTGPASAYIDFDKMLINMKLIKQYTEGVKVRANQHIFFNALMLILYLEEEY